MDKKILVIDIETTGFLNDGGKIVELGAVELDLANGNRKIVYDKVVHERGITKEEVEGAWIIENSSLTVEEVRMSPSLDKVKIEFQNLVDLYKNGVAAYNVSFDTGFLKDRGFTFDKILPCPMKLSTPICKIPFKNGRGTKYPKVEEAYKFFFPESEYIEEHRGADDAMHESEIIYELYKRGEFTI